MLLNRLMAKKKQKKPLEAWQIEDAGRLKAIWLEHKERTGMSQEDYCDFFNWKSQSSFSQYVIGEIGLNHRRLMGFSELFDVKPAEISPTLAKELIKIIGVSEPNSAHILDFTESPAIRRLAEAVNTGTLAEGDAEALEVIAERMKKPRQVHSIKLKDNRPGQGSARALKQKENKILRLVRGKSRKQGLH